jgi:hypothetical protein
VIVRLPNGVGRLTQCRASVSFGIGRRGYVQAPLSTRLSVISAHVLPELESENTPMRTWSEADVIS